MGPGRGLTGGRVASRRVPGTSAARRRRPGTGERPPSRGGRVERPEAAGPTEPGRGPGSWRSRFRVVSGGCQRSSRPPRGPRWPRSGRARRPPGERTRRPPQDPAPRSADRGVELPEQPERHERSAGRPLGREGGRSTTPALHEAGQPEGDRQHCTGAHGPSSANPWSSPPRDPGSPPISAASAATAPEARISSAGEPVRGSRRSRHQGARPPHLRGQGGALCVLVRVGGGGV